MLRLLYGDDRVSMEAEVSRQAMEAGEDSAVMNVLRFDGQSVDLEELAAAARSLPFFGGSRVIVVTGLGDRLKSAAKDQRTALVGALEGLPESTELLLVEPELHDKPEAHPLFAVAQRQGKVCPFQLAATGNVEDWLVRQAQSLGTRLGREVAVEIHRRVGDSAILLQSELEKLSAYALDAGPIKVEDVRLLVTASPESHVFDLVEAIGRRDARAAVARLEDLLLRQSEPALSLLAMIARQLRQLVIAKDLLEGRASQAVMARELRVPPWVVRRLVAQSRLFQMDELERALEGVLAADCALKGGADLPEDAVLTQLVVDLTTET